MTKLNLFDKNQPEDLPESFQLQRLGCKVVKINFLKLFLHLVLISTGILLLLGLIWRRSGLSIYSRNSLYFQYILRWALFDHLQCVPYSRSSWIKLLAPLNIKASMDMTYSSSSLMYDSSVPFPNLCPFLHSPSYTIPFILYWWPKIHNEYYSLRLTDSMQFVVFPGTISINMERTTVGRLCVVLCFTETERVTSFIHLPDVFPPTIIDHDFSFT